MSIGAPWPLTGKGPTVNVLFADNGQGLSRDAEILCQTLESFGCRVRRTARSPMRPPASLRFAPERVFYEARRVRDNVRRLAPGPQRDLNIFLESVVEDHLPLARRNWLIPNQEWLPSGDSFIGTVDLVLFKTEHARRLLEEKAKRSHFLGFTATDCRLETPKQKDRYLHVAGWNPHKGTARLVSLWHQRTGWPELTVVAQGPYKSGARVRIEGERLSTRRLRLLQNASAVHVAPSEVEGFGHSLLEALSCGALLITTDAPPMNEVVGDSGAFLVPVSASEPMGSGTRYFFAEEAFFDVVERVIRLGDAERGALSRSSRAFYERSREEFRTRLKDVIDNGI